MLARLVVIVLLNKVEQHRPIVDLERLLEADRNHRNASLEILVLAHFAIDLRQLFAQQLQLGIDNRQFESDEFAQFWLARRTVFTTENFVEILDAKNKFACNKFALWQT